MPVTNIKVNLDQAAAYAAHQVALQENRSLANAVNTLVREAWARRLDARRREEARPNESAQ